MKICTDCLYCLTILIFFGFSAILIFGVQKAESMNGTGGRRPVDFICNYMTQAGLTDIERARLLRDRAYFDAWKHAGGIEAAEKDMQEEK